MKRRYAILLTSLIVLSLIPAVMAQEMPTGEEIIEVIFEFFFGSGVPDEWLAWNGVMQFIFFPLIALFAVFYGIMEEIHIFRSEGGKNAQKVIAVVMAFVGGKLALGTMRGFLMANALWGTVLFGILLLVGITAWGLTGIVGGVTGGWGDLKRAAKRADSIDKRINKLDEEMVSLSIKMKSGTANEAERNRYIKLAEELRKLSDERRKVFPK